MLFLDLPDVQAQMTEPQPVYVMADASSRLSYMGNFGFCTVADSEGSITGGIDITWPFRELIPKRILKALYDSGRLGVSVLEPSDEDWLAKWQESFAIKVLREPQYGEIKRNGSSEFVGYTPRKGYLGKDRMDILIEGKSPDGHPVSARASVFIRVISRENSRGLRSNDNKMRVYIKQNCPVPKEFWKISQSDLDSSNKDYAIWLQSAQLSSLLATASQSLTDFQDLPGSSVGQTTGTGAAGNGWYIDPSQPTRPFGKASAI